MSISRVTPLERKVLEGVKPGAYITTRRAIPRSISLYEHLGLEAIQIEDKFFAIAQPQIARDVWEQFEHRPRFEAYRAQIEKVADGIGSKSVAQALVSLDLHPRKIPYINPYNLENPEVAILQGALLGYHSGCVDYYIATRYEGVERSPIQPSIDYSSWPDPHVLCPPCRIDSAE